MSITVDNSNQHDWYLHIDHSAVSWLMVQLHAHVDEGQLVAYSGAVQVPGGPPITGPHLHFEVQTGQLDVYATSLDPIPVLLGATDMTPNQDAIINETRDKVNEVWDLLRGGTHSPNNPDWIKDELEAIKTAIAALPIAVFPPEVQAQLVTIASAVAKIESRTTISGTIQ